MKIIRPNKFAFLIPVALALVVGSGCESTSTPPPTSRPDYSDITCTADGALPGHYEDGMGNPVCSVTDPMACNGKPSECSKPGKNFGMCGDAPPANYTCVADLDKGVACNHPAKCKSKSCNSGVCGEPPATTSDGGNMTSPDMGGGTGDGGPKCAGNGLRDINGMPNSPPCGEDCGNGTCTLGQGCKNANECRNGGAALTCKYRDGEGGAAPKYCLP